MGGNSKFLAGLLLGAAAAAAVGYFLTTDKGKQFVEDLKSSASEMADDLKESYQTAEKGIKQTIQKGKTFVEDLEKQADHSAT